MHGTCLAETLGISTPPRLSIPASTSERLHVLTGPAHATSLPRPSSPHLEPMLPNPLAQSPHPVVIIILTRARPLFMSAWPVLSRSWLRWAEPSALAGFFVALRLVAEQSWEGGG